ncbi:MULTISPECIES: PQQ-dependent sugar dehydrogenase [unclassified Flavobacterium]|uniref:PQQ-dependent sugar dehydrogenase n=1 Tax=unclassified Flavobacterium TaxID=196869 RepID=UPI00086F0E50|nr:MULTISPECIES: PQQ-dependent sugar dehydrogenase [unclassified Flavobacterium]MBN9284684.1 PQQ-dependent sugar dehydrogenase [Flavobacterium sp.]ODS86873.1 MAG: cadherin [Chryseobacterium sp. SCN 40-13]OJV72571.1 MAG: cadherin [Flavobacterium sp. 40-81]
MKKALLPLMLLVTGICFSQTVALESFGTGFSSPVEITHAGDTRLFVVERGGAIKILNANGTVNPTPFLNLSGIISSGGERGLLGLAFHPNYSTNGFFYVNYTNTAGNTVISRYSVNSGNPDVANASSASILLTITQPYSNHNGGSVKFGPDGYLYIGMGDGGSGGDPENRAQNINELLGKMLRIDVNNGTPYGIPANNPYVGIAGADEIWAIGVRNPWKFSFNRSNGDLWIADVGQNNFEEINKVSSTQAGLNYGWRCYEGNAAYNATGCAAQSTMTFPLAVTTHSAGNCSITGGYVYTGTTYPNFQNKYFFTDYCASKIGMVDNSGNITYSANFSGNSFVTFGEDNNGELYVGSINNGTIYKIKDSSLSTSDFSKTAFTVYPNPARAEINIKSSGSNFPTEVTVFDMNGKQVAFQKTQNPELNTIKTSHLATGLYLLHIMDNNGNTATHKLAIE